MQFRSILIEKSIILLEIEIILLKHESEVWLKNAQGTELFESLDVAWHVHDGGPYPIETSPLICRANQWTGFYVVVTSARKELNFSW